ncbi:MAG TPA: histidinol-phosphate transaminase, partial [Tepidisphaeraceae bacterium]|nr:histidinol-phosphate transaminase [Tepidisphaeraceae bacterium]
MSLPFNPALKSLPVYQPGRPIEEVARELGLSAAEIIKLASNENSFGPSPLAAAAIEKALKQAHLYPDGNAFYLKRRLAEKLALEPGNLIFGNGSNEIIEFVGHALLDAESEVVVSQYCFAVYPIVTHLFGAKLVTVPAKRFGHDLAGMLKAITSKTKIVFVANPNNPTGTHADREEIVKLINGLPPQVLLVIDAAYAEYVSRNDYEAGIELVATTENTVMCRTFSKIHGL